MSFRSRQVRAYLFGCSMVIAVVGATSVAGLAAQSTWPPPDKRPRIDPWPCRVVAAQTLRQTFAEGWERSQTIRSQCEELAASRAVVATVKIPAVGETIVLLAHELQHVVEKTRGLDLEAESKRPQSGVWKAVGGYETRGAVDVTRQVSGELREGRQK